MNRAIQQVAAQGDILRLVQITDSHLAATPGGALLGLDTDFSLGHVLDLVARERPQVDLVLGTGDISDHGSIAAYRRALLEFGRIGAPVCWLVGNHDDGAGMASILGRDGELVRIARGGNWQVLLLNSQILGEVGGELGQAELDWLELLLLEGEACGLHSLVCLHHQPVPMGSAWIDDQQVADSAAFFALLKRFPAVKGVLWGHVHQQLDTQHNGIALMSTPSSCIQFAPNCEHFKVDDQPPGYRWLDLYPDGRIETAVSRVRGIEFSVDLDSDGYL